MHLKIRRCCMENRLATATDAMSISKRNTLRLTILSLNLLGGLTILKIFNCYAVIAIGSKVIEGRNISSHDLMQVRKKGTTGDVSEKRSEGILERNF